MKKGNRKRLGILAAGIAICVLAVTINSLTKVPPYEYVPFTLPENFQLSDSRLISLGTATHGNIEPFEAGEQILRKMKEEYGSVAIILEEEIGAGALMDKYHSVYDLEKNTSYTQSSRIIASEALYANQEMAKLLQTLEELDIRLYGNDISTAIGTLRILYDCVQELGFPRLEDIKQTQYNKYGPEKMRGLIADVDAFILQKLEDKKVTAQEFQYISHLTDAVIMNLIYEESNNKFNERDRLMAENVLWVMDYEQEYYNNDHFLLMAHNAHIISAEIVIAGVERVPMGTHLSQALEEDNYVIVTEAQHNSFYSQNFMGRPTVFYIENKGDLFKELEQKNADVLFLRSEEFMGNGILKWNMGGIGFKFSKLAYLQYTEGYVSQMDISNTFDAMLLFKQMTPNHKDN